MKLRFIGQNGSMGLTHGRIYKVSLRTRHNCIVAEIYRNFWDDAIICPYSSPQAFANNWELA